MHSTPVSKQIFCLSGLTEKPLYTLFHSRALGKLLLYSMCGIRWDMVVDGGDVMVIPPVIAL